MDRCCSTSTVLRRVLLTDGSKLETNQNVEQQSNYVSPLLLTVDLAFIAVTFLYHLRQPNQRLTIQNHRSHHQRHPPRLLRKPTTSRQLVDLYLDQIEALNPLLRSVQEVNPDALNQADEANRERQAAAAKDQGHQSLGELHRIPILLKDSIGTKDKLNTTCRAYALLGSTVARYSGVVQRLRKAGAVILGKASLSEWYGVRSSKIPDCWCARGGQALVS